MYLALVLIETCNANVAESGVLFYAIHNILASGEIQRDIILRFVVTPMFLAILFADML